MQFDTKIALVIRTDLEAWQKLNVAAFLTSGIAATIFLINATIESLPDRQFTEGPKSESQRQRIKSVEQSAREVITDSKKVRRWIRSEIEPGGVIASKGSRSLIDRLIHK